MIEKFISTKCIGYNKDYSQHHFQSVAIMTSGEQKTLYQTNYMISGSIMEGCLTEIKPDVEVSVTPLQTAQD